MAIGKPRGKNGARPVYVYNPAVGKKVYVGSRTKLRGKGGAEELARQKAEEFANAAPPGAPVNDGYTVRSWSVEWLEDHHGPGTTRPERGTRVTNEGNLTTYLKAFGERALDGGVGRKEALAWARERPWAAKTVSAMYNEAINLEVCERNPLANRQQPGKRERKFIKAITEQETDRIAEIALDEWGQDGYGRTARSWTLFAAWVGARPGETFTVELNDMNFDAGTVKVRRVKKRGGRFPTDIIVLPEIVIESITAMPFRPTEGPLYRTVQGKPFAQGSLRYYWEPIRARFRQTVDDERWAELLDGAEGGEHFDFYALRHRVASHIVAMGGNEYDAAHQLGNSPRVCRETYIHNNADQRNERNRGFLVSSKVVDLDSRRDRKGA